MICAVVAPAISADVFTYDPDGSGANDYMSLAQEIARAS
jgi:hypothetical protein